MLGFVGAISKAGEKKPKDRRRAGRILTKMLDCPYGDVVDLSMTGMRIRATFRPWFLPKKFKPIKLRVPGLSEPIMARFVWIQRHGLGYDMGFDFDQMSPEQHEKLKAVARTAMTTEFMGLKPMVIDAA